MPPFFQSPIWKKTSAFWQEQQPVRRVRSFLDAYGAWVVVLTAVLYYGQYYRSGLNLGGEGGTVAVVAMRLLEGQRPFLETVLNYNVMWFYPVAWLFEVTGPNYIALRLFFFAICTVTGVMAFLIVRRVTGNGLYAFCAALGPVLIPGMLFRNYMGFLAVLNMGLLLQGWVFEQQSRWRQLRWIAGAGAGLGLTYLVRIDLGVFFSVITVGLAVLFPWGYPGRLAPRFLLAAAGLVVAAFMVVITHVPFYLDAKKRGFEDGFVQQYSGWLGLVRHLAKEKLTPPPSSADPAVSRPAADPPALTAAADPAVPAEAAPAEGKDFNTEGYLQKQPLTALFADKSFYDRAFVLITYLPIPLAVVIVLPASLVLLGALVRGRPETRTGALVVLITTGSALTLFPQYFFFRPDTPHLSEFMVPFMVALACTAWVAGRALSASVLGRVAAGVLIFLMAIDVGLYFYHSWPKESAGTIAARRKRNRELVAENGVRVFLKSSEHKELQALCDIIKTHTSPDDYLVAYPYSPTVNFMTNRRSYEANLYIDNAHNVSGFHQETLAEIEQFRPAVIIIDNRAINQTEESRFSHWAAETYAFIRDQYRYMGTFRRQEIYLRPDLAATPASAAPAGESGN